MELDATAIVAESLLLQFGLGVIDAEYDQFQSAADASGIDASDLKFVLAPDYTYNLAATYDLNVGDNAGLSLRLEYSYVDDKFSDDFNQASQRDYHLVDTSLTYTNDAIGLKVALYGKNVFDEIYYDFGTNFSASALAHQSYWLTPPRTYDVELT